MHCFIDDITVGIDGGIMAVGTGVSAYPLGTHQSRMAVGSNIDIRGAEALGTVPDTARVGTVGWGIVLGAPLVARVALHGGGIRPFDGKSRCATVCITVAIGIAAFIFRTVTAPLPEGDILVFVHMAGFVGNGIAAACRRLMTTLTAIGIAGTPGMLSMPAAEVRGIAGAVVAGIAG